MSCFTLIVYVHWAYYYNSVLLFCSTELLRQERTYFLHGQCLVYSELVESLEVSRLDDNMHLREKLELEREQDTILITQLSHTKLFQLIKDLTKNIHHTFLVTKISSLFTPMSHLNVMPETKLCFQQTQQLT